MLKDAARAIADGLRTPGGPVFERLWELILEGEDIRSLLVAASSSASQLILSALRDEMVIHRPAFAYSSLPLEPEDVAAIFPSGAPAGLYTKNNQAAARAIKAVLGLDTLDFSALLAAPEPPVLSSALRARLGQHLAQLAHTQGRRLTAVERVLVEQSSERPPEPEVMYGGFSYQLQREELIVVSWMRMVGGSGQRHVITEHGARLVDEGFV